MALELVLSLKLAYYMTGQQKWKDEYDLLVDRSGPYNYLKLIASLDERWRWFYINSDDDEIRKFENSNKYSKI